ncbi:MAG: hypothetical protein A2Z14_00705 [Chloroflexi bacterium RBG_16_48_8]|nr:MAG: hypothetical protein A2Z14_00705 [Chloroflexi bacterium RBG_16_48_8]
MIRTLGIKTGFRLIGKDPPIVVYISIRKPGRDFDGGDLLSCKSQRTWEACGGIKRKKSKNVLWIGTP